MELKSKGLKVEVQRKIEVYYKEIEVGEYYADLIVKNLVILELKAADSIAPAFENQILNYLTGTNCEVWFAPEFWKET